MAFHALQFEIERTSFVIEFALAGPFNIHKLKKGRSLEFDFFFQNFKFNGKSLVAPFAPVPTESGICKSEEDSFKLQTINYCE